MDWISVEKNLPEGKDWVIAQTQDGTIYPAVYCKDKKQWSPVFRGGAVDSLMHGKVIYWQKTPEGYPYLTCEHGHSYLQTPANPVCPICKRFGFIADKAPAQVEEETPVEAPVEEAPVEEEKAEEKPKPVRKTSKKKPEKAE